LFESWKKEQKNKRRVFKAFVLILATNSLVDEIRGKGGVFDWSEYVSVGFLLIYIIYIISKTTKK
jgi:hypothetical protein